MVKSIKSVLYYALLAGILWTTWRAFEVGSAALDRFKSAVGEIGQRR